MKMWTAYFELPDGTRYQAQFIAEKREQARVMAAKSHHNIKSVKKIIVKSAK